MSAAASCELALPFALSSNTAACRSGMSTHQQIGRRSCRSASSATPVALSPSHSPHGTPRLADWPGTGRRRVVGQQQAERCLRGTLRRPIVARRISATRRRARCSTRDRRRSLKHVDQLRRRRIVVSATANDQQRRGVAAFAAGFADVLTAILLFAQLVASGRRDHGSRPAQSVAARRQVGRPTSPG